MDCTHDGYHSIFSEYDGQSGVLSYVGRCDDCGVRLGEVHREEYRPAPNLRGNDEYLKAFAE